MSYYTERHGFRKPIEKTEKISVDMYAMLLESCKSRFINLAWKYPKQCPDGKGICGVDTDSLYRALKFEIPDLYRDPLDNEPIMPRKVGTFLPYAILDLIEFTAKYCLTYKQEDYHPFFQHYHYRFTNFPDARNTFIDEINQTFEKLGLLYILTPQSVVERVPENGVLSPKMEADIQMIPEEGVKELLQKAILKYKTPGPNARQDAVEKIWDALERLKTYYTSLDKKASASKIVNDMANGQAKFITLFDDEFKALTAIGNDFRIRHHETNKIDIDDVRHYDYFFNRCLSLIALAIQYLQ